MSKEKKEEKKISIQVDGKETEKKIDSPKKPEKKEKKVEIDLSQAQTIEEAVKTVKEINKAKFNASIEIHFRLGIDPKRGDQQIRGTVSLPHGTGKSIKIAAFVSPENEKKVKEAGADLVGSEELIAKIKKLGKTDFQVAIAEPVLMKNLAVIAKILGTRGLMPSPKNETITTDPVKTVTELKKGKISFKNDDTANLHIVIGKINFTAEQLIENYQALLEVIKKSKPASSKGIYIRNISLSSSMSPGIKVVLS